jgi:TPR repeat protein
MIPKSKRREKTKLCKEFTVNKFFEKHNISKLGFKNEYYDDMLLIIKNKNPRETYDSLLNYYYGSYYLSKHDVTNMFKCFDKCFDKCDFEFDNKFLKIFIENDIIYERYLERSCEKNNPKSLFETSKKLNQEGDDCMKEYYLIRAIEQGSVDAILEMINVYKGDLDMAQPYIQLAAEHGHVESIKKMGNFYKTFENYYDASIWWEKAADLGELDCMLELGRHYHINQVFPLMDRYYLMAFDKGNEKALHTLVENHKLLGNGDSVIRFMEYGFNKGNVNFAVELAKWYSQTDDIDNMYFYYMFAIKNKHQTALRDYCEYLRENHSNDSEKEFLEKCIDDGLDNDGKISNQLGIEYYYNYQKNYVKAAECCENALDKGLAIARQNVLHMYVTYFDDKSKLINFCNKHILDPLCFSRLLSHYQVNDKEQFIKLCNKGIEQGQETCLKLLINHYKNNEEKSNISDTIFKLSETGSILNYHNYLTYIDVNEKNFEKVIKIIKKKNGSLINYKFFDKIVLTDNNIKKIISIVSKYKLDVKDIKLFENITLNKDNFVEIITLAETYKIDIDVNTILYNSDRSEEILDMLCKKFDLRKTDCYICHQEDIAAVKDCTCKRDTICFDCFHEYPRCPMCQH